jgi:hypothetical protein
VAQEPFKDRPIEEKLRDLKKARAFVPDGEPKEAMDRAIADIEKLIEMKQKQDAGEDPFAEQKAVVDVPKTPDRGSPT